MRPRRHAASHGAPQMRPQIEADQLPGDGNPRRLGKGRRFWGLVVRTKGPGGSRAYAVEGKLLEAPPEGDEATTGGTRA